MYLLPVNLFRCIRLEYSFTCTHVKSLSFNQMNVSELEFKKIFNKCIVQYMYVHIHTRIYGIQYIWRIKCTDLYYYYIYYTVSR